MPRLMWNPKLRHHVTKDHDNPASRRFIPMYVFTPCCSKFSFRTFHTTCAYLLNGSTPSKFSDQNFVCISYSSWGGSVCRFTRLWAGKLKNLSSTASRDNLSSTASRDTWLCSSSTLQGYPVVHPASCSVGTGGPFPVVHRPGTWS